MRAKNGSAFSMVDIIEVLTKSPGSRKYWSALKTKLEQERSELSQELGQLKLLSDDCKKYATDVADTEQILRVIQSIPSAKAKPFKQWLAKVGYQTIEESQEPEKSSALNNNLVFNFLYELPNKIIC